MRRHSLLALSGIGLLMLLVVVFVLVLEETGPEASSYRISGGAYDSGMNGSPLSGLEASGLEGGGLEGGGRLLPGAVIRSVQGIGHQQDGGLRQLAELPPAPTASEPEGGDPGDVACVNDSALNGAGQLR